MRFDIAGSPPSGRRDARTHRALGRDKPYRHVYSVIRDHIKGGRLPPGLVLLEGAIAEVFGVSPSPVRRALGLLAEEQLIQRFEGRGYLVAARTGPTVPLRLALQEAGLTIPRLVDAAIQTRGTWEHLYAEVEDVAAAAMAFGRFRFVETEMAEHFHVSRTVVRDVLARLQERGLVRKDASSHWVVGPLTATALTEFYDIREALEPKALVLASPHLAPDNLRMMVARINDLERRYPVVAEVELAEMERDLHVDCVLAINHGRLREALQRHQLPLITKRMFNHYLGIPANNRDLREHRMVLELLLNNSPEAAAAVLADHLQHSRDRSLTRLKLLAVIQQDSFAPYLHRDD